MITTRGAAGAAASSTFGAGDEDAPGVLGGVVVAPAGSPGASPARARAACSAVSLNAGPRRKRNSASGPFGIGFFPVTAMAMRVVGRARVAEAEVDVAGGVAAALSSEGSTVTSTVA